MPQLTHNATHIIEREKIVTKDGEITINLNLTLTIKNDNVAVTTNLDNSQQKPIKTHYLKTDEEPMFEIPDFEDNNTILDFGKKV